ncbi:hypothetical protein BASA81_012823 [Batrachochytrium salamandrivorans]|nr:hypothetical protein BASA81_012823 [Batrachochytrium salamandrivorans]
MGKLAVPAAFMSTETSKPASKAAKPLPKPAPVATAKPAPATTRFTSPFKSSPAAATAAAPAIKSAPTGKKKTYLCGLGLVPLLLLLCLGLVVVVAIIVGAVLGAAAANLKDMHSIQFAQTHVIPPEGLSWYNNKVRLMLIGKREALFMFKFGNLDAAQYTHVFGYDASGKYVGAVPISPPNELPPVEANQTDLTYSTEHYSATLPGAWIVPNFGLAVSTQSSPGACCTTNRTIFSEVSSDNELDIYTLPTYLYGADEINSPPLAETMGLPLKNQQEFWAKQPVSKINFRPHPIGMLKFPWMVAGPTSTKPARVLTDRSQEEDGFYTMGLVLGLLGMFRDNNGHGNSQYYSAMQTMQNGKPTGAGGGLGGGSRSAGDSAWSGIFIHEVGHGMGLPHAGGAYPDNYPYEQGSLQFSKWGYDTLRKVFLPNTIPPTTTKYDSCKGSHLTSGNRCIKQDYMQGGAGDQAKGDIFTMASDYNAAKLQEYVDSRTFPDPKSSTGYSAWNKTGKYRYDVLPTMQDSGLYGLTNGIPIKTNVKVYTIIATYSLTTAAARKFYPLNDAYTGNLMRYIDPNDSTALDELKKKAVWYCRGSGCDYTFKMTYTDGSIIYQLHQGGFRKWFNSDLNDGANNPLDGGSFRSFTMNFPGDKKASKVEMLNTPVVLTNGFPASPAVLMSYVYP